MTSPGVKRPLDFEQNNPPASPPSATNAATPAAETGGESSTAANVSVNGENTSTVANGNKRRCTNYVHTSSSRNDTTHAGQSPFKNSTSTNGDIALMIRNEIEQMLPHGDSGGSQTSHTKDTQCASNQDSPLLTIRQTQAICEKLIRDREQELIEDYDRILASKLAEQYDIITKANYINSYVVPRLATTLQSITETTKCMHTPINSLAATSSAPFSTLPKSAATNLSTAASLPDLTTLAATLQANNHHGPMSAAGLPSQFAFNIHQQGANVQQVQQQAGRVASMVSGVTIMNGPVLLVSNLDEQLAVPESLFTLFGVFGDVLRVKILFNKKDNALIQMADANQAQVAQGYLDKQKIFGKVIRVTRSKHQLVQMPRESNQTDAGLTKDFSNSPLHRFKIPGSRNYLNIYPPSNTLHISNIPSTIDEKDIHRAFKDACGFGYSLFKFFPKDRKMALMKFSSIEQATIALIKMHNYPIRDDNILKVSFSKSVMQP